MLPPDDRGPAWLADYKAFSADITKLMDFADRLTQELEQNFRPHAAKIVDGLAGGVPFGRGSLSCLELTQASGTYGEVLGRAHELLTAHDQATLIFAQAVRTIATEYRDTDAFSAATLADVTAVLPPEPAPRGTARRAV